MIFPIPTINTKYINMDSRKAILIMTPIGRIKWLQAPEDMDEILFHLSRTFNTNVNCLILEDSNLNVEVTVDSYQGLLKCEWDIILNLKIDNTLKDIYGSGSSFKGRDERGFDARPGISSEFRREDSRKIEYVEEPRRGETRQGPRSDARKDSARGREAATKSTAGRGKKGAAEPKAISEEEKKLQDVMKELKDCGFTDVAKCRAAAIKANYDIERAIELLL